MEIWLFYYNEIWIIDLFALYNTFYLTMLVTLTLPLPQTKKIEIIHESGVDLQFLIVSLIEKLYYNHLVTKTVLSIKIEKEDISSFWKILFSPHEHVVLANDIFLV